MYPLAGGQLEIDNYIRCSLMPQLKAITLKQGIRSEAVCIKASILNIRLTFLNIKRISLVELKYGLG